jgi:hypothetical protein
MRCFICGKEIEQGATKIGSHGNEAHFSCAQDHPEKFAEMVGLAKRDPRIGRKEKKRC